jgi:hypothetical protein
MHHTSARLVISRLLEGNGFGERALALVTATSLGDADHAAMRLRDSALAKATALPADNAPSYVGPLSIEPLPADEIALCNQLCPAVIKHPADTGMQLACLAALVHLWPHVGSDERPRLRQCFLNGMAARTAPVDSRLTSEQLCAWQRDLPTSHSDLSPNVASLKGMLVETSPKEAYKVLAEHLGISADIATLSWVLGALTVQLRLQFHDADQHLLHVLLGTVACEQLTMWAQPEHLTTLVSQLALQLWWCRHHAELAPVTVSADHARLSLAAAVATGNLTVAQRAARAASKNPAEFWEAIWALLEECLGHDDPCWLPALDMVGAITWRTGTDLTSPDDAAALGTEFAELAGRHQHRSQAAAIAAG